MSDWSAMVAATQKALSPDGTLPAARVDPATYGPLLSKATVAFDASIKDLERKLLEVQNVSSQMKNALKQYADIAAADNFGLSPGNPADKKRIEQARVIMAKALKKMQADCDSNIELLGKLDHVITDLRNLSQLKS